MAVLSEQSRFSVWAKYMHSSEILSTGDLLKTDLREAVNAIDDFLNTNASAINSAFPVAARTTLTVKQKALLLEYVISQRYLVEV